MAKLLQSEKPGYVSDNSLGRIEGKLEGEGSQVAKKALNLLREFSKENVKDRHEIWQVLMAIRHLVYDLGLRGGPKAIEATSKKEAERQQEIEGITNPTEQETAEQFAERMRRIRTYISLKAFAAISDDKIDGNIGMIRARFKKPDKEHKGAIKYLDLENKKM